MEFQNIFNLVGGAILVAIGWWCKEIWDSVKSLKNDIKDIEVALPTSYVRKEDINGQIRQD